MHLPCPTKQQIITKAEIAEEFIGFLRFILEKRNKHLLFNLQDRTSWRENARATVLEDLQKMAEFKSTVTVITLSKDSNFYNQIEEYNTQTSATHFMKTLKDRIFSKDKEYFIPLKLETKEVSDFVDKACLLIHDVFFMEKKDLSRQERCNFIEVFYHLLTLKIVEIEKFSSLSFTCKDAIDTGAAMNGSFFGFLKIIEGSDWTKEDEDFFLWLIYAPALQIRERAIISERLIRQIACIALIDAHRKGFKKALKSLYSSAFLDAIKINYPH